MTSEITGKNNEALPLRVLIVEDSPTDAVLVERELRRGGYDVTSERVETADAMRDALNRAPWDIILSDYSLPSFNAPAALEVLQASKLDLPFIIISGTIGEEVAVESLKAGAHDYLMKDKLTRLTSAVKRELACAERRRHQKQEEERLRESEANLRDAQKMAKLGRWELDLASNRLKWSDSIFDIFEIDPEQFGATHESFLEMIHPDDRERVARAYTQSLENKTHYEVTHRVLMKDGRIKWMHEVCRTEYDSIGTAIRFIGFVQDITERKQTEETLLQKAADLEAFNEEMIGREKRMIELKEEVNRLCAELQRPPVYPPVWQSKPLSGSTPPPEGTP